MTKLLAAVPLGLALLGAGAAARADIYKWIDANGVVNYTDNPELAGGARVQMLKTAAAAPAAEAGGDWRQREAEFQRRQQHKLMAPGYRPREAGGGAVASAVHRGGQPETDATRCALARAVIDGAVGHVNDLPVDQHDRDTAANDIRAYCR